MFDTGDTLPRVRRLSVTGDNSRLRLASRSSTEWLAAKVWYRTEALRWCNLGIRDHATQSECEAWQMPGRIGGAQLSGLGMI